MGIHLLLLLLLQYDIMLAMAQFLRLLLLLATTTGIRKHRNTSSVHAKCVCLGAAQAGLLAGRSLAQQHQSQCILETAAKRPILLRAKQLLFSLFLPQVLSLFACLTDNFYSSYINKHSADDLLSALMRRSITSSLSSQPVTSGTDKLRKL